MTESSKFFKKLEKKWKIPDKIVKSGIISYSTNFGHFIVGTPLAIRTQLIYSMSYIKHHSLTRAEYDRIDKRILLFDERNLAKYCKRLIEVHSNDIYALNRDKRLIHPLNNFDIAQIRKEYKKKLNNR